MDKIKRYIECYIPVTTCNLRCPYCYITQHRLFEGSLPTFQYSPKQVRQALSKERLGGICLINLCAGGETLLAKEVVDYTKELLLEGHYVMIVTNGTISKRFREFAEFPVELTKHLFFKFSYHYLEFKKRNLFDVFFNNIKTVRDAGCSFTLELTPSDEAIQYIDDIKELAIKELGAPNHITIARDEKTEEELPMMTTLPKEEYINTWKIFDSNLFNFKLDIFEEKRTEFCYAGDWSIYINLASGEMKQCYRSYFKTNIFEDPTKPIPFCAIGNNCKEHHCYNGHAFLSLGDIPSLKTPTYASLRNRVCQDGTEWLQPEVKQFMQTKLSDSNEEYSPWQKMKTNYLIQKEIAKQKTLENNNEEQICVSKKKTSLTNIVKETTIVQNQQNEDICDSLKKRIINSLQPLIKSNYIFLDLPYYSNIGDTLIWLGTEELFNELSGKCIGRHSKETFDFRLLPHDCTILLQGGGNMGDTWREHQEFRNEVVRLYPDNRIIFLPQTIYYDSKDTLDNDIELLNKHQHLTICARDEFSFNLLKDNGFTGNMLLIPDMAFCINRKTLRSMMLKTGNECLFLLRNDKEFPKQYHQRTDPFKDAVFEDWPSIQESGYKAWNYVLTHDNKDVDDFFQNHYLPERIKEGVEFASKYKVTYSTRLHVIILRLLLGLEVNVLDNSYGKNSHFIDTWLKESPLINSANKETLQILSIILDYEKRCKHFAEVSRILEKNIKNKEEEIDGLVAESAKMQSWLEDYKSWVTNLQKEKENIQKEKENIQKENIRLVKIVKKQAQKFQLLTWSFVAAICIIILISIIN